MKNIDVISGPGLLRAGKPLTFLSIALIVLAAAAAVRIAATENVRNVPGFAVSAGLSADELLSRARESERKGNLTEALADYRRAVLLRPPIADRRSPEYLGAEFEGKVKEWVSALRKGEVRAGPSAIPDASFLFRRLYGGCG
ncbi:MAG: hypothetical protein HY896_02730 [Deltaproteobacteria bacterium]|nr:hypothetical protein [Deltaproteobacteria bacterium]